MTADTPVRITIWNEGVHERTKPEMAGTYPDGIHGAIAEGLRGLLSGADVGSDAQYLQLTFIAGILSWVGALAIRMRR